MVVCLAAIIFVPIGVEATLHRRANARLSVDMDSVEANHDASPARALAVSRVLRGLQEKVRRKTVCLHSQ